MNVVGRVGSFISQGVYYVATPFHPFGGAVDVIIVEQEDETYRSTPWYVKFGKFQGVLKGAEKIVRIMVNGVETSFHMYLDNSGEAFFLNEVKNGDDKPGNWDESSLPQDGSQILTTASQDNIDRQNENGVAYSDEFASSDLCPLEGVSDLEQTENHVGDLGDDDEKQGCQITSGSNGEAMDPRQERASEASVSAVEETSSFEFDNDQSPQRNSVAVMDYDAYRYETLHHRQIDGTEELVKPRSFDSEVVLIGQDGHLMMAPVPTSDNMDTVQLDSPRFHLVPGDASIEHQESGDLDVRSSREEVFQICLALHELHSHIEDEDLECPSSEFVGLVGKDDSQDPDTNEDRDCSPATPFSSPGGSDCVTLKETVIGYDSTLEGKRGPPGVQDSHANDDRDCSLETSSTPLGVYGCVTLKEPVDGDDSTPEGKMGSHALAMAVQASDSDVLINKSTSSANENFDQSNLQLEETSNLGSPAVGEECSKLDILESQTETFSGAITPGTCMGFEISLCGNLLHAGMQVGASAQAFDAHRVSEGEFKVSGASTMKDKKLIVRWKEWYLPWDKAAPIVLGTTSFGLDFPSEPKDVIPVEQKETETIAAAPSTSSIRGWRLWSNPFRRVKTLPESNISSNKEVPVDSISSMQGPRVARTSSGSPCKQFLRTNIPTTQQIASLNLKDGQNVITFSFSTMVLGMQQVDAHIYLWKWNARIVISDVDGTITKSDVLGQVMPLVGRDWTQFGVARLFSAIKENGYQLLFLSARAISQAYLTRSFLLNLKQDGKTLPNGPVVLSPNGLFPSLYREVIRRAPHEFKIACLEDIKALFPSDYNPFYAGFGNRDTDEISYRNIGIPKGKIFIINPKGEVVINHSTGMRSYTSLHTLVHDMFPPTLFSEQEDFNSWNYWKMPLPDID